MKRNVINHVVIDCTISKIFVPDYFFSLYHVAVNLDVADIVIAKNWDYYAQQRVKIAIVYLTVIHTNWLKIPKKEYDNEK